MKATLLEKALDKLVLLCIYFRYMKTAAISVKIDPKVKKEAQRVAKELGFSLSDIVNASLRNLAREKTVSYTLLEPSPMLKHIIRQARKERSRGDFFGPFNNVIEAEKFLDAQ